MLSVLLLALGCGRTPACDLGRWGPPARVLGRWGGPAARRRAPPAPVDRSGVRCATAAARDGRVSVSLAGPPPPDLARPARLRIRPVVPASRNLPSPPPGVSSEALLAWLAATPLPDHVVAVLEPQGSGNPPTVHLLSTSGGLTDPVVTEATCDDGPEPSVRVHLAEPTALLALTTAHVGEVVVVTLDDEVLMAPIIQERISGGEFSIVSGTATEDPTGWCTRTAGLLSAGSLGTTLTLESEALFGPP